MAKNLPISQENMLDVSGYNPSNDEHSRALSYSLMAAEIDEEERLSHMSKEQPHVLQQNEASRLGGKTEGEKSERQISIGGNKIQQKMFTSENLFGFDQNHTNRFIAANVLQKQRDSHKMNDNSKNDITKQHHRSFNNDILCNFDQSNLSERIYEKQLRPAKCLGQKIISSVLRNDSQDNNLDLGNIAEQSEILQDHQSVSDASHFIQANLNFSDSKPSNHFQQNLKTQEQYVITISATKQKTESPTRGVFSPLDSRKVPKQEAPLFCFQAPVKDQKNTSAEKNSFLKTSKQESQRKANMQQSNHAVKGSIVKPKQNKMMIQSKLITNSKQKSSLKEELQRREKSPKPSEQNAEKKSNIAHTNRMKSSYDPTLGKTQYKTASVAKHLSEPDNHVSKEEQAKKSMIKLQESLEKEEKNLNLHVRQQFQKLAILGNQVQNMKNNLYKNEEPSSDNMACLKLKSKKNSKQEKKEQNAMKLSHKIETMKNLAPQQLFSGPSSIDSIERRKNQQKQSIKHLQKVEQIEKAQKTQRALKGSEMTESEEINFLRHKIELLQKRVSMNDTNNHKNSHTQNSKNIRRIRSEEHQDEEKEGRPLEVNFKDYNQTSIAKILKKKKSEQKFNSSDNISHELDSGSIHISDISIPKLQQIPKVSDSPQKLANLGIITIRSFDIKNKNITLIEIKRYKDGVQYYFQQLDRIITWEFSGNFYLGSCSHTKISGFREKEGEGLQYSPGNYIYKGSFSKNMKSGYGVINFANGEKYEGEWKKDLYHGNGMLQTSNSKYEGQFEMGKKQGQGKEYFNNGDSYFGHFIDNKFDGKGKYYWKNQQYYIGQFKNGFMEGMGQWKSEEGDTYEGNYYRNMKHGYGTYRLKCGRQFHGKFEHGYPKSKNSASRNIIPAERSIPIDFMSIQQSEQLNQRKISLTAKEQTSKRFTIRSLESMSPERRVSSKKYIYQAHRF